MSGTAEGRSQERETRLRFSAYAAVVVVCTASPLFHLLWLQPEIPEGTFFLISRLPAAGVTDGSNAIYSLARPPVFALIDWVFSWPLAYLVIGYLAHCVMHGLIAWLAYLGARRGGGSRVASLAIAISAVVLVFPIGHWLRLDDYGISLIPHDTFHIFSHRTLFWMSVALATGWLAAGRLRAVAWTLAVGCYVHPTAGALALLSFMPVLGIAAVRRRARPLLAHLCGAALVGAGPLLLKLVTDSPVDVASPIDSATWYSSLIKDEADDFSFLYQALYRPILTGGLLGICVATLWGYAWSFRDVRGDLLFWAAAMPPVLFLAGLVTEVLFAVVVATPLVRLLVPLTPGYRMLSYGFFPLIVLAAGLCARWSQMGWQRCRERSVTPRPAYEAAVVGVTVALTVVGWGAVAAVGVSTGGAAATAAYARWALGAGVVEGIDAYLVAAARGGGIDRFTLPHIRRLEGPARTYPGERNLLRIKNLDRRQPLSEPVLKVFDETTAETFAEVVDGIRRAGGSGEGVIVPPYFMFFRDALPENPVFFQEHHDGNLMMGSPDFLAFWRPRMQDLLGFDYESMPSKHSGLTFSIMRRAYLSITSTKARDLAVRYPDYPLFVTEASHELAFARIAQNQAFVVYDLRLPRPAAG